MSLRTYRLEEGKVELAGVPAAHDVGGVGEEAHGEAEGVHGHGVRAGPDGAVPEAGRPARLDVRVAATATAAQRVSTPLKHSLAGLAGSQLDWLAHNWTVGLWQLVWHHLAAQPVATWLAQPVLLLPATNY